MRVFIPFLTLLLMSSFSWGEQKVVENGYEVHFNAFNSSFVTPEVAAANDIIRSKVRALVNVAVFEINDDGKTAVPATLTGQASNLLGQMQTINFSPIKEGDALYYIGGFRFSEAERMTIKLSVRANPNTPVIETSFTQTFYTE